MKSYGLAVFGNDLRSASLRERLRAGGPFAPGRMRLLDCGPETTVAQAVGRDDLTVIYLGLPPDQQAGAIATALGAGKVVLAPPPVASAGFDLATLEEAAARGSGRLVVAGNLRHTLAAQSLLDIAEGGELGIMHSIYLATRWRNDPGLDEPAAQLLWLEHLWEAADLILALAGEAIPLRVYATSGPASGGGTAPVMFNARFAGDLILTGEIGPTLPQGGPITEPETDIEIAGSAAAIRCEPYGETVLVAPAKAPSAVRTWQARPVLNLLEGLILELDRSAQEGESDWPALARRAAFLAAIEASLAGGGAVVP